MSHPIRIVICFYLILSTSIVRADYMAPGLRAEVEQLKLAAATAATTPQNYAGRATVLWQWLNARARAGGHLPVNATLVVRPETPTAPSRLLLRGLDFTIKELTLLDEHPDAIGTLQADEGPFEARSFVTLRQRYTVGNRSLRTGGGFVVGRHFMPGYDVQGSDPSAKNFVSISSSNDKVTFVADKAPIWGMHGGFRGAVPQLFYRIETGTLRQGDVVTLTYGDTSGGGPGMQMISASTDFLPLPIYLDFEGDGDQYTVPMAKIKVTGTKVAGVHGFAPSVVRPGEPFQLSVRAEDQFYNRASGDIPGFVVFANGKKVAQTKASDQAISVLTLQFAEPGVQRITFQSADGLVTGVANPVLVSDKATRIFWGDTHGHSGFAEGIGTPERFMTWAKDDARLDFVLHSEHDIWMDDAEWQVLKDNAEKFSEPGRFVGYLGYEWTTQNIYGGHHNVMFRHVDERRIATQLYPTLSKLYAGLRANFSTNDVLVIPHAHQSGDYRQSDPELQNLVEIMSQHGTFEWFGRMYLQHGHRVGFIAASDNHLSQPGYTSVWRGYMSQRGGLAAVKADKHGRDEIFDAMKNLQTYATTGDKIILDVTANGHSMGQRAPFARERTIAGRVIGTAPVDTISIIRNDQTVWEQKLNTIEDGRLRKNETFYVSFSSDSVPMHPGDNARGTRGWLGSLRVTGADIDSFSATDQFNPEVNRLQRDAEDSNRLHFVTGSRGDASSIVLKLTNVRRNMKVVLDIEEALERGSPTKFRPPATTPAAVLTLAAKDLVNGETNQVIPVDIYEDTVTLRRVRDTGEDDVTFNFTETRNLQGDYYFVRVKLTNDALAWSSPVWIGGFPPR